MNKYDRSLLVLLIIIIVIGGVLQGGDFLSMATLNIFMYQIPELGLVSLALMLIMIESGLNLSVMAMTTLSGIVGAIVTSALNPMGGFTVFIGLLVIIAIGALTGAVNGFIVSYLEVPTILGTLGTMLLYRGIAMNITQGGHIASFSTSGNILGNKLLGVPASFIIFCGVALVLNLVLTKHRFGRHLYKIGIDKRAAVYSGIAVNRHVFLTFVISGVILGIAAFVMTSRYNSISVDYGSSYLMSSIVVVSLGGVMIGGGRGTVIGVVLALVLVNVVIRLMNIANVDADIMDAVFGGLLLLNILFQHVIRNYETKEINADKVE